MVRIKIDGTEYEVMPGKNLLDTCLGLGIYVPHFCYHAALGSVGACRLCAVKKFRNAEDVKGRIVMSCMEPVADGLIVSVRDPEAAAFRKAVIESLMINHPHDCPVCDEGGECHLQDMTVMTGHSYRRFDFRKRTYRNQELGPFISHEMNRCIQCYRCVRFYNDYAGGKDLAVLGSHDHVYFGRHEDGTLGSEFSGNLAEVCPTGVFTDKTLKSHYTRKWDLTNAPSVCVHCSVGCNTIAGERYGTLRRIMSRYNGAVNGYFLCDRGRFGYEFVNDPARTRMHTLRKGNVTTTANAETVASFLKENFTEKKQWIGIGSPRASLESNYALSCFTGKENFFHGISRKDHSIIKTIIQVLKNGPAHSPSLKEIEKADAVLILGEDVTNTAPMTALAVRQASRNREMEACSKAGIPEWNDSARREKAQGMKIPLFIATSYETKLDELAEVVCRLSPDEIADLGFAIASALDKNTPQGKNPDKKLTDLAERIAASLGKAESPLIISGTHAGSRDLVLAAANIAKALSVNGKKVQISFLLPECNSMGLGMTEGGSLDDLGERDFKQGRPGLVILENDLYRRMEKSHADALLEKFSPVIVLDHQVTETTRRADLVIPAGTFAESEGTLVNNEGRAQRFYRVLPPDEQLMPGWSGIRELITMKPGGQDPSWKTFDELSAEMSETIADFAPIKGHMPDADFRILNEKIRRQTLRFSGRTAITANINVSEPAPPEDPESPLAFSMEGSEEIPPSSLVSYYWVPGWNSYQAMNFYLDGPNGSLKGGDPGIRLIEEKSKTGLSFFEKEPPRKHVGVPGEWLFIPVYKIFGSEELSSVSPSVAQRIGSPFVTLNRKDAESLGIKENEEIKITVGEQLLEVRLKTDESLPTGIAGLSVGFPGMPFLDLPGHGKFMRTKDKA